MDNNTCSMCLMLELNFLDEYNKLIGEKKKIEINYGIDVNF